MSGPRLNNQGRTILSPPDRRWLLAIVGLSLLAASHPLLWHVWQAKMLFAPLGIGLALTAWLGFGIVPGIALVLLLLQTCLRPEGTTIWTASADALLTTAEIAGGWWFYCKAGGTRRLDDPRSTTLFLLVLAGLFGAIFSALQTVIGFDLPASGNFGQLALSLWVSHILGIVAVTPPLLAVATPWLVYYRSGAPRSDRVALCRPSALDVDDGRFA